jgi:response regulator NasT
MRTLEIDHLRVLIADESEDRLANVATMVVALGHIVIARELDVSEIAAVTARERPDVALVAVGDSSDHALELIDRIVREAACPVIAVLHAPDPEFVKKASTLGVFAFVSDVDNDDWQSAIDIVLRRFTEYHDLHGTFGPRAIIERAKGILMERHGVDENAAGEMLDKHARSDSRTVLELATALAGGFSLGSG